MPDATQYTFSHKELATLLVKELKIHEGVWGLYVKFGIGAVNAGPNDNELAPAAVVPVLNIGLQQFEKENNLSVDAAKVNPKNAT
jgi:hypothetical protein